MKIIYEELDVVLFGDVSVIPDDMLVDEYGDYDPQLRARLERHQKNRSTFMVTEIEFNGEAVHVKGIRNDDKYCFMPEAFKPSKHTLDVLLEKLK